MRLFRRFRKELSENPGYLWGHLVLLLLGLLLTASGIGPFASIGPSVAAVGLVGYVTYLYSRRDDAAQRQGRLLISEYGFRGAFPRRGSAIQSEYDRQLAKAQEGIDILGFGLRALREDYAARFPDWARRVKVRILLLDPLYPDASRPYAGQRDVEEGTSPGTIQDDVALFIAATAALRASNAQFQVRLMRCLPSVNLFRVDGMIFWGPYLIGGPSRNLPTFLVAEPGHLYAVLADHFETIWKSDSLSSPVV